MLAWFKIVSPLEPEKMEFVSDGTRTIPMQNVAITATVCKP